MLRICLVLLAYVFSVHAAVVETSITQRKGISFNYDTAVDVVDTIQQMMIEVYTGLFGAIGVASVVWSIIIVFSAVYYAFAVTFLNKKDAEEALLEDEEKRALTWTIPQRIAKAFSQYQAMDKSDVMASLREDSCYKRTVCQVQSIAVRSLSQLITAFFSRGQTRVTIGETKAKNDCFEQYPECNLTRSFVGMFWNWKF